MRDIDKIMRYLKNKQEDLNEQAKEHQDHDGVRLVVHKDGSWIVESTLFTIDPNARPYHDDITHGHGTLGDLLSMLDNG